MSIKIKTLNLRGKYDFSKNVGDVLRSLKIEIGKAEADFDELEIFNEIIGRKVITRIKIVLFGVEYFFRKSSLVRPDERFGAEVNRQKKFVSAFDL